MKYEIENALESPAEREAYPVLKRIADKFKLVLSLQEVLWDYRQHTEGKECHKENGCHYCNDTYDEARIDFVMSGGFLKQRVAIEIDGAAFHSYNRDSLKNNLLRQSNYCVLRYPARMVFGDLDEFEMWVTYELKHGSVYSKKVN